MNTSWICLEVCFLSSCSEDVFKTNIFSLVIRLQKMSSRRHDQDEYICLGHMSSKRLPKTSRRLQGMFKTSWGCLQNVFKMSCKDVFKTSSRRFQDVSLSCTVLVDASSRCLWDVFNTCLRLTAICLGHTWEFYGHGTKFPKSELFNTKTFETVFLKQFMKWLLLQTNC